MNESRAPRPEVCQVSRRGFIALVGQAAAAVGLGGLAAACRPNPIGKATSEGAGGRTTFITPNPDFYLVAVNPDFHPAVTPDTVEQGWSLEVRGLGGATRRLGYADLRKTKGAEFLYTFECIGNDVGGDLIGNARWRGVPLRDVLAPVLTDRRTGYTVMIRSLDDFFSSVSIERCLDPGSFIAYEMNGEPLPPGHGFPARVVLPDLYGMKQPRWLKSIEIVESAETTGYWEKRGWASEVPVKTMSRLDRPPRGALIQGQSYRLTGIAFAGGRGIQRVQVSLDEGRSWEDCRLVEGGDPGVWALWAYDWNRPPAGSQTLVCRATDGEGRVQTAQAHGSYPDGASGYHRIDVDIGAD